MTRRVVVTGMGLVMPHGNTVKDAWGAIKEGQTRVDYITYFDTTNFLVKIAAQVSNFDPADYMPKKEVRRHDGYQHYIIAATQEAMASSGLEINEENALRSSSVVGSSTGGTKSHGDYLQVVLGDGEPQPRKITPFAIPMLVVNGGSNVVALMTGAMGPSCVPASACASGADCIGYAYDLIRMGRIDRALAGNGEYPISEMGIAAFDRVQALSRRNDNPGAASRPFDRDRDGFVFSEGAGVLVLEELETAKARGANILAELVGYSATTDAFHRTAPEPEGRGAAQAMQLVLNDAQINPEDVQYINAHGTSTPLNDVMETKAIKSVFGDHAYNLAVSSTKSMTGHAMGATAAFEAVMTVSAICDQVAPPTINLENPDPGCDLDYVANVARDLPITYALSNSFGFGGHNACLLFRRFDG